MGSSSSGPHDVFRPGIPLNHLPELSSLAPRKSALFVGRQAREFIGQLLSNFDARCTIANASAVTLQKVKITGGACRRIDGLIELHLSYFKTSGAELVIGQ